MGFDAMKIPLPLDGSPVDGTSPAIVLQENTSFVVGLGSHVFSRWEVHILGYLVGEPGQRSDLFIENALQLFFVGQDAIALAEVHINAVLAACIELQSIVLFAETTIVSHAIGR